MLWTNLKRVAAPANPLISTDDAKAHLRIGDDLDADEYLDGLVAAATAQIEGPDGIGIALVTQTWRLSLDGLPCDAIRLPLGPAQSIVSITYLDEAGQTQTLDPALYTIDTDQNPAVLCRAYNAVWPATRCQPGAVKITFTCGFGDNAEDVPADLRQAATLLVEAIVDPQSAERCAKAAQAILNRYRACGVA